MGGIGKAVGGMVGGLFGKGGSSQRMSADELQNEAYQSIKGVELPKIEDLRINPEDITFYQRTGQLTPQLEQAIAQNPSLMQQIQNNPELLAAQMATLRKLQQVGQEGGLTVEDKAKLYEASKAADRAAKSRTAAITQGFTDRGLGGSNAELMAQLQGGASDAEAAADTGFKVGAEANRRALDAVTQSGELASKLRGQDFDEAAAKAKAADEIAKFNTQNQRDVEMRNQAQKLGANQYNLEADQRVADTNVGMKNQLTQYNKNLLREDYDRQMDKANALAGAAGKYSAYQTGRAAQEDAAGVNKGQAIGGMVGTGLSLAGALFSDEKLKKNVKKSPRAFDKLLDHIKGVDFEYKDEDHGEGDRHGVLAQDLEKSKLGKDMVKELPEGKAIDINNAVGTMLGSQARLHERLKKLEKKDK